MDLYLDMPTGEFVDSSTNLSVVSLSDGENMTAEQLQKMQAGRKAVKPKTHTVRIKGDERGPFITLENYTRSTAIALMCVECLGYETHPKDCTSPRCPLYPFRRKTLVAG